MNRPGPNTKIAFTPSAKPGRGQSLAAENSAGVRSGDVRVPGSGSSAAEARGPGRVWIGPPARPRLAPRRKPPQPAAASTCACACSTGTAHPTGPVTPGHENTPHGRVDWGSRIWGLRRCAAAGLVSKRHMRLVAVLWQILVLSLDQLGAGVPIPCDPVSPATRLIDDGGEKRRFNFILRG